MLGASEDDSKGRSLVLALLGRAATLGAKDAMATLAAEVLRGSGGAVRLGGAGEASGAADPANFKEEAAGHVLGTRQRFGGGSRKTGETNWRFVSSRSVFDL